MPLPSQLTHALRFFSLPNLDSRLSAPTSNPTKLQQIQSKAGVNRWTTLEFKFYWICFLIVVPYMYYCAIDLSSETNVDNYPRFSRLLTQGWMFGRKVDNSDSQYRFFRDNFPLLSVLMFAHVGLRKGVKCLIPNLTRKTFDFWFGLVFLVAVHGVNSFKVLFHVMIMFAIARLFQTKYKIAVLLLWSYGITTLFLNDRYRNIKLAEVVHPALSFLDPGFKGIVSRWDVFYNFTLLRSLSFNLDFLNRTDEIKMAESKKDEELKSPTPNNSNSTASLNDFSQKLILEERDRMNASLDITTYSLINYFSYLTYAPLFIAGPVLTFNDFHIQSFMPLPSINLQRTALYAARFLFCVLVMEFLLHFIYVVAISKTHAWINSTPFQISMIGLFNLNIIWLKLLIPWRFFRLWALLDGIDPPENMIRCMDNNYSALSFWKGWHRSFNKWVVKYVYIPLGGQGNRLLASLAVFTFVAVWHDIELKLLIWGWLVVLFIMPEYFLSSYFRKYHSQNWWYRHLCAIGGVLNVWLMMIANLYGFCLGNDGTKALLYEMFCTSSGLSYFLVANFALFIAVQVMFELREDEKRRGIDVKC
ncbi:hypothetical protein WICPIJ_000534 [Wickerhamomyces pijperi]|uniref:Glycerol uptake protein 1 n=1 Tax=Wickerhamomyces pijperi TaxID=599730 RepID=A0A9P8TRL9_WICPI|nr:hypothetical protein WICPIJ_000534 [Wickerhamomyces pijperi]